MLLNLPLKTDFLGEIESNMIFESIIQILNTGWECKKILKMVILEAILNSHIHMYSICVTILTFQLLPQG